MKSLSSILLLFAFTFIFLVKALGQEILGCGGFVKTDLEINFSQIEVKLYTKQGTLKDQTDCAPNNGYYFLPLYDKGEYILKIEPPAGWSFEPKEVVLNVDGSTDRCSKGKDINFSFKGFAITGKVVSAGESIGPSGVKLTLHYENTQDVLHEGITREGGIFQFSSVSPGSYIIRASHPRWKLSKDSSTVQLTKSNAVVSPGRLVVAGYDVSGTVTSDAEPIKGVSFVLFSAQSDGITREEVYGCDKTPLAEFKMNGVLCHVRSDEQGHFIFPTVPPGHYRVVPHYKGPHNIKFDVRPAQVEFTVLHQSFLIETEFKVKGFSVSGRVLVKEGGKGISGAVVFLDNKESGVTGPDGSYHLENMQAGIYQLHVQARDMEFTDSTVKITPNTPQLADTFPSAFKICGHVAPHHRVSGSSGSTYVLFSRGGQSPVIVETQAESGLFCVFLEPGLYEARIRISDIERNKGLTFYPEVQVIEVKDGPMSGIEFTQLKVKLTGKLRCLEENCGNIPIHLQGIPGDGKTDTAVAIVISQGNRYTFTDILPGEYRVSVDKNEWCWDSLSHVVNAGGAAESTVPMFTQTGYAITFISTHDTQVEYKLKTVEGTGLAGRLGVTRGTTKSCVAMSGSYILTPVGCHRYAKSTIQLSHLTAAVHLTAVAHTVGGRIISSESVNDVFVNILSGEDGKLKHRLGPLTAKLSGDGKTIYYFELIIAEGEIVILEPVAGVLLFTPQHITLTGIGECVELAAEFKAEKGKLVEGQIIPPSAGIRITVSRSDNSVVAFTETSGDGKFRIGPLQDNINYRIKAEKEGYVLVGPDANGNFNAHKLAEVIVEVVDKADGKPLQGVLLSLSGGESFRRNSQTGLDGKMTFSSLSPSEYFLRPMMKEYRFEPASKMITVIEGATVNVLLSGIRVAFSAYGIVTSLNGEEEEGIVVEAVGQGKCSHYQEESTTENTGQFRIRGLHPECSYLVRVKHTMEVNQHIVRATPSEIAVKASSNDVTGLHLIVFHPLAHMDITAHVTTSNPDYFNTLRVKLCREDSPDSPVHIARIDGPNQSSNIKASKTINSNDAVLVFPPVPLDGRAYFLQLESTLSHTTHSYSTNAIHFRANSTYKLVHLLFNPKVHVIEQELGQSSYLALAVFVIVVLVYLNQQKLSPLVAWFSHMLNSSLSTSTRISSISADHSVADAVVIEPVIGISKRKPKPRKT